MAEDTTKKGTQPEVLSVVVEEAKLQRDPSGSGLPTLIWQLRITDGGKGLIWHRQLYAPDNLTEIKKNLALCGIVCSNEEVPSQFVKAAGCKLEIEREGERVTFTKRLDEGVFTGTVEKQNVAEELPL